MGERSQEEQICVDITHKCTYESNICVQFQSIHMTSFVVCFVSNSVALILQWREKIDSLFDKTFMNSKMNFCHSSVIKLERMNVSVANSVYKLEIFCHQRFPFVGVRKWKDKQKAKLFTYRVRMHILSSKSLKQLSAIDLIFTNAFPISLWTQYSCSVLWPFRQHMKWSIHLCELIICQSIHWHLQT